MPKKSSDSESHEQDVPGDGDPLRDPSVFAHDYQQAVRDCDVLAQEALLRQAIDEPQLMKCLSGLDDQFLPDTINLNIDCKEIIARQREESVPPRAIAAFAAMPVRHPVLTHYLLLGMTYLPVVVLVGVSLYWAGIKDPEPLTPLMRQAWVLLGAFAIGMVILGTSSGLLKEAPTSADGTQSRPDPDDLNFSAGLPLLGGILAMILLISVSLRLVYPAQSEVEASANRVNLSADTQNRMPPAMADESHRPGVNLLPSAVTSHAEDQDIGLRKPLKIGDSYYFSIRVLGSEDAGDQRNFIRLINSPDGTPVDAKLVNAFEVSEAVKQHKQFIEKRSDPDEAAAVKE